MTTFEFLVFEGKDKHLEYMVVKPKAVKLASRHQRAFSGHFQCFNLAISLYFYRSSSSLLDLASDSWNQKAFDPQNTNWMRNIDYLISGFMALVKHAKYLNQNSKFSKIYLQTSPNLMGFTIVLTYARQHLLTGCSVVHSSHFRIYKDNHLSDIFRMANRLLQI